MRSNQGIPDRACRVGAGHQELFEVRCHTVIIALAEGVKAVEGCEKEGTTTAFFHELDCRSGHGVECRFSSALLPLLISTSILSRYSKNTNYRYFTIDCNLGRHCQDHLDAASASSIPHRVTNPADLLRMHSFDTKAYIAYSDTTGRV